MVAIAFKLFDKHLNRSKILTKYKRSSIYHIRENTLTYSKRSFFKLSLLKQLPSNATLLLRMALSPATRGLEVSMYM